MYNKKLPCQKYNSTYLFDIIVKNRKKIHLIIMKFIIFISINISCLAQDTLQNYRQHYLIDKEITCCKSAKNQLKCIDSLIQVNLKEPDYSGKVDYYKTYFNRYKKLALYYSYAGYISGLRGNLEQSLAYFDQMGIYLDTLSKNKRDEGFINLKYIAHYQKIEFCSKAYWEDSVLFNRCNCIQFFPEYKNETVNIEKATAPNENQKPVVKYPNWGEFYINDTLRINKHFVSDSASIIYFQKILRPLIQTKLVQNPYYFEMLGESSMNIKRDTIIYKLTSKYEKGKHERKWELVFATSQNPEKYDLILFVLSNVELPGHMKNLEIFIPIVLTTENSNNDNHVNVYDDHFLMAIRKYHK